MEHILRDKTCGLYPSDSTWKAMANTVYGENENLEEYSRHLKEVCVHVVLQNLLVCVHYETCIPAD